MSPLPIQRFPHFNLNTDEDDRVEERKTCGVECASFHRTLRGSPFTSRRIADSESSTIRSDCFLPWTLAARIYLLISSLSLPSLPSRPRPRSRHRHRSRSRQFPRTKSSGNSKANRDRVSTLYSRLRNYVQYT